MTLRFLLFHRRLFYFTWIVWTCIICALLWFPWNRENREANKVEVKQKVAVHPCLLLRWNYDVQRANFWQLTKTNMATVLLFYGLALDPRLLPLPRKPGQLWALMHEESPYHNPLLLHESVLKHFNFSSTVSRYSDYPLTTSFLQNIEHLTTPHYVVPIHQKEILRKNLAPVLYLQSNCATMTARDKYVTELMKHIDIDSYGNCLHNRDVPHSLQHNYLDNLYYPELLHFMAQYKFIVAIESAVCDDYITEKFWRPLIVGSIPIYLGSPTIRDWEPNNLSAIYISDFASPQELAIFLQALTKNNTEYNKYLKHKYDQMGPITNPRLLKELLKREKDGTVDDFECSMCNKLYSLQPGNIHIVNKNHYQYTLNYFLQKNENFTTEAFFLKLQVDIERGQCEDYCDKMSNNSIN